ncbi:class I SAM-dependent methyltransferase [Thermogymnomonas acidicola]|nr:class I SAM-dependent methyltransferase family protein [Thermogymnomonas acidicola]
MAQEAITEGKRQGWMDRTHRVAHEGDFVLIPLRPGHDPPGEVVEREVEEEARERPRPFRSSFDVVGDIAIVKVRDVERAREIASSILASNSHVSAVFHDAGISGTERRRRLSFLAGSYHTLTEHRENGIRLFVDVEKVYFSPRLATERMRVCNRVADGERVLDMFAGIGPFSITIARYRRCSVTAVDINSDAIGLMRRNIEANRLLGRVEPVLGDAREVVAGRGPFDSVIMNLPHSPDEFLDVGLSVLREGGKVFYYRICDLDTLYLTMERFREAGCQILEKRKVHGYSPREDMYHILARKG